MSKEIVDMLVKKIREDAVEIASSKRTIEKLSRRIGRVRECAHDVFVEADKVEEHRRNAVTAYQQLDKAQKRLEIAESTIAEQKAVIGELRGEQRAWHDEPEDESRGWVFRFAPSTVTHEIPNSNVALTWSGKAVSISTPDEGDRTALSAHECAAIAKFLKDSIEPTG